MMLVIKRRHERIILKSVIFKFQTSDFQALSSCNVNVIFDRDLFYFSTFKWYIETKHHASEKSIKNERYARVN